MHLIGVEDTLAVNRNASVMRWPSTAGNDETVPAQHGKAIIADNFHGVRIHETRVAFVYGHAVAAQLRLDHLDLPRHDGIGTKYELPCMEMFSFNA